ncbi:MAG TPA: hypothetical protein VJ848_04595 [Candidatus Angelobacter sp.]|jgi:hypothetical protein|nr:hypothetical protein [Candidatus Angelobacter sp.]
MKTSLAAIIAVLTLSLPLCAQQRGRTQVAPARTDLTSMLLELDRTTAATFTDISHTHIERWKGGWKSGFTTSSSHKNHAEEAAVSLQRNLRGPLPEMIRDALNAHGNLAPTFKVYEDLSLVCETLDTLLMATEEYGNRKDEYEPLAIDFNQLTRLRRGLSSYIMQRAAAADSGGFSGGSPAAFNVYSSDSSPTDMPRKIIIDNDDPPAKKPPVAKKKAAIQYTNQY